MGSKYRTQHAIPEGFPQILKDFAREILRMQPDNVYLFGAQYFRAKQREAGGGVGLLGMSADEMEQYLFQVFHANTDGREVLDKKSFKKLLEGADLGLTKKQIKLLYSEADQNDDGDINYAEFVHGALSLLQAMAAREQARAAVQDAENEAEELAREHLVHGMTEDEVTAQLEDAWFQADSDGSGYLDQKEIKRFLKDLPLNLTRKERNVIMAEIEFDENGVISREQFLPLARAVMLEMVKQQFFAVGYEGTEMEQTLREWFMSADKDGSGLLKPDIARRVLKEADLGLTKFQLYTIVAEAPLQGKRIVIDSFVPICARMIQQLVAPTQEEAAVRAAALEHMQDEGLMITGMGVGELQERLMEFFRSFDTDGSGFLEMSEFEQAITSGTSGTGIEFSAEQAQLLLLAADEDQDGRISYEEFMRVAIQLLEFYERESRIREFNAQNEQ